MDPLPRSIEVLLVALALLLTPALASGQEPQSASVLLGRALERFAEADFERSLGLLDQAAADPSAGSGIAADIQLRRGLCLGILGREAEARAAFRQALQHNPESRLDPEAFKPALVALLDQERRSLYGRLEIRADVPGARVFVDGLEVGPAPQSRYLRAGSHRVEVRGLDGAMPKEQSVEVRAGEVHTLRFRRTVREPARPPAPPRGRVWTWVCGGAALALLGTGVGLAAWAQADHEAWQEPGVSRERWEELGKSGQNKQIASNVLFGVGGALALTAVVLFFVENRDGEPDGRALSLTVAPGPSGALLGLNADF